MMAKKRVLVACGAGIATSTVVAKTIEEMAKASGIDIDVKQVKISEIGFYEDDADLLVTTARIQKPYKFPIIQAQSFLTGIGVEDTKKKILEALSK